jgi:hypothetical protein
MKISSLLRMREQPHDVIYVRFGQILSPVFALQEKMIWLGCAIWRPDWFNELESSFPTCRLLNPPSGRCWNAAPWRR